jgi:hypothetical protein
MYNMRFHGRCMHHKNLWLILLGSLGVICGNGNQSPVYAQSPASWLQAPLTGPAELRTFTVQGITAAFRSSQISSPKPAGTDFAQSSSPFRQD